MRFQSKGFKIEIKPLDEFGMMQESVGGGDIQP
jgi:hypothetical protein